MSQNPIHRTVPLGVPLVQALAWVGLQAREASNADACETAMAICKAIEGEKDADGTPLSIDCLVPSIHIVCQACDFLRAKGRPELVELLERFALQLRGPEPRLITGTLSYHVGSTVQLDDALERLRETVIDGSNMR